MAGQKGNAFLLKRGDGQPTETFTTVGGFRTHTFTINDTEVDVTDKDSVGNWRELLAGAGILGATIGGSGPIKDTVEENNMLTDLTTQAISNYQVIVPGIGTFEGPFKISEMSYEGPHDAEATWSVTLASAGQIGFTVS